MYIAIRIYSLYANILSVKILATLMDGARFAKFFFANIYKYNEITENLPVDLPKFSTSFDSLLMVHQNFSTYDMDIPYLFLFLQFKFMRTLSSIWLYSTCVDM